MNTKMRWFIGILLSLALVMGMMPAQADNPSAWATLQQQISDASAGGTVILTQDVIAGANESALTVPAGKTITIDLAGHTIDRGLTAAREYGNVITVEGSLTIKDSIGGGTIKGGWRNDNGGGIHVKSGSLEMTGGTISGNKANNGGGVYLDNGTFIIKGGEITNNTADNDGGGVFIIGTDPTFSIQGGKITNNTAGNNGGGVYSGGDFTMTGGSITGNTANGDAFEDGGGGVFVYGIDFNLEGGSITNNSAKNGGGVYIGFDGGHYGKLIMKGGSISKNTASFYGGGVYIDTNCGFTMNNSSISGNTASRGGGVYITESSVLTMTGGTISNNKTDERGGGIYNDGIFNLSGNPKITGNTLDGADSNAHLKKKLTIADALSSGASVGVTMDDPPGIFTSGYNTYNAGTAPSKFFKSDDTQYAVTFTEDRKEARLVTSNTVKFDVNGHGTAPANQYVAAGDLVTKPEDPTADGYAFGGWYKEASCANAWDFDYDTVPTNSTIILYAKWTERASVISIPEAKTLTYTGSAQALVSEGKADGGTMQYALGENGDTAPESGWMASVPTGTEAKTYYVWYKAAGDETHSDSEPKCIQAKILPADPDPVPDPDPDPDKDPEPDPEPADWVTAFVTRCYIEILGRNPDKGGLDYWVKPLKEKYTSAAECVYSFLTSAEFATRSHTPQQVIEMLYKAMMGRPADEKGLNYWLEKIKGGATYADVVNGLCASMEFRRYCAGCGIIPGSVKGSDGTTPDPLPAVDVPAIEAFLTRCYRLMLGRNPDPVGLKYWTDAMANGTSAAEVVYGFMTSNEQTGKQLSARQTIRILYQTMLDRQPEEKGMNYWLACFDRGDNLAAIVNGFCESAEFRNICAKYGMKPGKVSGAKKGADAEPAETWDGEKVRAFIARIYKAALGREASESETDYWTAKILNGKVSPKQAVKEIMTSTEFGAQGIQGEELIKAAYRVYMNREADATGLSYWTGKLNEGTSVSDMLDGFAASAEFAAVVAGLK